MKVMVWTCDRCRVTVEVPRLLVEEDGSVVEHGCGPREWIFDREAESNVIFGPEGAA